MPEFARLEQLEKEVRELRIALESRIVIEQAKGVLSAVLDMAPEDAFEILRCQARNTRRHIHDVAREVIDTRGDGFAKPS
jgi:AmiR/NasT family two-component response regulator